MSRHVVLLYRNCNCRLFFRSQRIVASHDALQVRELANHPGQQVAFGQCRGALHGGDIDANPTLRTAVQKAKAARMTNDAIDRAVKRGTGESDGGTYESVMYEGYANSAVMRRVTPYGLMQSGGRSYVTGLCHQSGIEKSYRLDRIRSLQFEE